MNRRTLLGRLLVAPVAAVLAPKLVEAAVAQPDLRMALAARDMGIVSRKTVLESFGISDADGYYKVYVRTG